MSKKMRKVLLKSRSDRPHWGVFFRPWGLLKTLTLKKKNMAKKLFKMPKNDPKMIQKWFKIAQIV